MQQAEQARQVVTTALERTEKEKAWTLVTEAQADVVRMPTGTPISIPMLKPASAIASQDIPATPTTAKTLLLLTSGRRFDRTVTEAGSESAKSSASHTKKLPSKESSITDVLLNVVEVQMDHILANQQTIMDYQHELQANQFALERRMDRIENLLLQMLKALQKGNSKGNQWRSSMIPTYLSLMAKREKNR